MCYHFVWNVCQIDHSNIKCNVFWHVLDNIISNDQPSPQLDTKILVCFKNLQVQVLLDFDFIWGRTIIISLSWIVPHNTPLSGWHVLPIVIINNLQSCFLENINNWKWAIVDILTIGNCIHTCDVVEITSNHFHTIL
jgi:hypothetical protein